MISLFSIFQKENHTNTLNGNPKSETSGGIINPVFVVNPCNSGHTFAGGIINPASSSLISLVVSDRHRCLWYLTVDGIRTLSDQPRRLRSSLSSQFCRSLSLSLVSFTISDQSCRLWSLLKKDALC